MVPVPYHFVLFFLLKELERTSSLSQLGTAAPDRGREQHGRLGMGFFVVGEKVLPSLP